MSSRPACADSPGDAGGALEDPDRFVRGAARIRRGLELGKWTLSESVAQVHGLLHVPLNEYVGAPTASGLIDLAARVAAEVPDELLLQAAVYDQFRNAAASAALYNRDPASLIAVRDAVEAARDDAVERALNSGEYEADEVDVVVDVTYSLRLLHRVADAFPVTADTSTTGAEMRLEGTMLSALASSGSVTDAVARCRALPSDVHRAAGVARIVQAYHGDPRCVDPLPDLVVDLVDSLDWSRSPVELDIVASYLLRAHRESALGLIERWALTSGPRWPDGRDYARSACFVAWCAGDDDLALRIARRDVTPFGVWDKHRVNSAADFVVGQLAGDTAERVDGLLRSLHVDSGPIFDRRLVDAAWVLVDSGEPYEAACLFFLSNFRWHRYRWLDEGLAYLDPRLHERLEVSHDERLALLTRLQAAGVPGTIRFDTVQFTGEGGGYVRFPPNVNSLRRAVAR